MKNLQAIGEAMFALEPFFRIADAGKIQLAETEIFLENRACEELSNTSGLVVFPRKVSLGAPVPQPEWMSDDVYADLVAGFYLAPHDVFASFGVTPPFKRYDREQGGAHKFRYWEWDKYPHHVETNGFSTLIHKFIGGPYASALRRSLPRSSWRHQLCVELRWPVHAITHRVLSAAFRRDSVRLNELTAMVKLFETAIPLGPEKNNPNSWVVLTL